jgi:peptidoglycan/LPS O-acetylase OafA/YrhL
LIAENKGDYMESKHIKSLDIIKGIAMMMVILVHYNQMFYSANILLSKFGQMGCQIFFVASGFGSAISFFKISKSCENKKEAWKKFYLSRIKAIGPAWWGMILIVFLVNTLSLKTTGKSLAFGTNRGAVSILLNVLFLNGLFPFCNNNVMPGVVHRNDNASVFSRPSCDLSI